MEGYELLDDYMNIGYKFIMGNNSIYNTIQKSSDMVFIPDPELSEFELAEELIEYFEEHEEYEKCANIQNVIKLKKVINKLI
tara:strand:+ start:960 stop:1205 length:246 start_codon:yes stop_codon:yes gene_type:complete